MIEKLYEVLEKEKLFEDCVMSENQSQYDNLWKIREEAATATAMSGYAVKYDVSID